VARSRRNPVVEFAADRPGVTVTVLVVVGLLLAAGIGKLLADRQADAVADERAEEVAELLDGTRPPEYLTLNAGTGDPGVAPGRLDGATDLESVVAGSRLAFLRFQPDGWWSAFAERCVVAEVRADEVVVRVEKLACARVPAPAEAP
jgi:hypothetical protein